MAKAGVHLSLGQGAAQASSFVRNIILARLISPADFGIASVLSVSLQIVEMLSNVSGDMLLIQTKDADLDKLQGTAQALRAGRSVANGLLIFALAWPAARLFGVPQATWAFRCLGMLPLLRGLFHLDMSRLQRGLRFAPAVITDAGANWCATLAAVPLALWLRSYAAMVWALLIQAAVATALSHILAERRYRWVWDRESWRRIASFGWPLMVNGVLMFAIFEGDRMIIGSARRLFPACSYTLADLGAYSVAFALTMAPTTFAANIASSLFLPFLSRVQDAPALFRQRYIACCQASCIVGAITSIGFITLGGTVLTTVYGAKYATGCTVIGWMGAMWAMRIIRVAPTLGAMAQGDSKNAMISNVARTLALIGMLIAAATGAGLRWIAISGLCGETLAVCVSVLRLHRRGAIPSSDCVAPLGIAAFGAVSSLLAARELGPSLAAGIGSCVGCTMLVIACMLVVFPSFRLQVSSQVFRGRAPVPIQA
jgi:O-antigen/teichoic acid export membrane protein